MAGTFDDIIRAQMSNSSRVNDPRQEARDAAAIQMNVARGGPQSTAMRQPMPTVQASTASDPNPQLPQSAPIPTQSPLLKAIADSMGENIPTPTARPNPNAMEMGDASVAELMNSQLPRTAPPIGQVQGPPIDAMQKKESAGVDPNIILATVTALGGAAGVAALIQRYRMGDPDASRTFEAIGMSPDDLSMFALGPTNNGSSGTQFPAQPDSESSNPQPTSRSENSKVDTSSNATGESDLRSPQRQGLKASNLPNSRPKAKPKIKVKAK